MLVSLPVKRLYGVQKRNDIKGIRIARIPVWRKKNNIKKRAAIQKKKLLQVAPVKFYRISKQKN